jgi:oxalate decarboxylase
MAAAPEPPQPIRGNEGATDPGPRDAMRDAESPDIFAAPATDHGTLPNLAWSMSDSHNELHEGGWARETTVRELPIAKEIAGVDMRLKAGAVRELHWHKQAEWSYMMYGNARITAIDQDGRNFVADVTEGDLWYFPGGLPHSIQGLGPDGCEFLLAFPDGAFSENSTFLLTDWFDHIPKSVLAKNFGVPEAAFANIPPKELYIFQSSVPGPLAQNQVASPQGAIPQTFKHSMLAQAPQQTKFGSVRITDTSNFPIANEMAAALVEVQPGAMRELHWHPFADEWNFWLSGQGRMGVFASSGIARTFDLRAGSVGYVPKSMGHYIENTGTDVLRFLELFASDRYADVSLDQWLALTPPELVQAHLHISAETIAALRKTKQPVTG